MLFAIKGSKHRYNSSTGSSIAMKWSMILRGFFSGVLALVGLSPAAAAPGELPAGFVYLADIDPTIVQDIRYAGSHNFIGRPIAGYDAAECILTEKAARALAKVQTQLARKKLSLIVWDCYRPTRATADFVRWTKDPRDTKMKAEFYPRIDKSQIFELGYLSSRSAHSRGSTVDLGIVPLGASVPRYDPAGKLVPCVAGKNERFVDGSIDFGTGYDCMDELSTTTHPGVSAEARANRMMLHDLMVAAGFKPYRREWWHFELIDEPFPNQSFDFPIRARKKP
jgi:zinc D-Ala-D-Ala dipeptidase